MKGPLLVKYWGSWPLWPLRRWCLWLRFATPNVCHQMPPSQIDARDGPFLPFPLPLIGVATVLSECNECRWLRPISLIMPKIGCHGNDP